MRYILFADTTVIKMINYRMVFTRFTNGKVMTEQMMCQNNCDFDLFVYYHSQVSVTWAVGDTVGPGLSDSEVPLQSYDAM